MTTSTERVAPPRGELAVVTGASSGIGAATARELARRGFHVLAGVRREVDAAALRSDRVEPLILDITDRAHLAALAERAAHDGLGLRALVNNAGIAVNAHGVEVVVVEPGGVATGMSGRGIATAHRSAADMTPAQHARYDTLVDAVVTLAESFTAKGLPAAAVARVVADAVTATRPRARYAVGRDAAVLVRLARLVPDRLLDRVLPRDLGSHLRPPVPA
ncbi:SDR family oxidoreductase [Umezawaea sp.]|uniref:SDR family oxidoreductase n=1 Tax=Umezawaea sp. TaxID=1955258 RepID=UPI002ED13869